MDDHSGCLLELSLSIEVTSNHDTRRRGIQAEPIPGRLSDAVEKKSASRSSGRTSRIAAAKTVVPDREHPTGTLLDRVCEETPTSQLESLTLVAEAQPLSRRSWPPMESHCVILRNPSSFSKKNPRYFQEKFA
jgi:hypothetical protein